VTRPRKLAPEEAALWAKVVASVTPYRPEEPLPFRGEIGAGEVEPEPEPSKPLPVAKRTTQTSDPSPRAEGLKNTLDGTWDRRLSRGMVAPESIIDLHGHNLDSAYQRLDLGLEHAIARGDRMLLLITGRPPRAESERPHARGAIRAAVNDWLAASRHAGRIAAVRPAHPSHGGAGALYIVLRRERLRNRPNS